MELTRREFLKESLATLGFLAHPALSRFALASLGLSGIRIIRKSSSGRAAPFAAVCDGKPCFIG